MKYYQSAAVNAMQDTGIAKHYLPMVSDYSEAVVFFDDWSKYLISNEKHL